MKIEDVTPDLKELYNTTATHPLQAYEWGEFRKKTGLKVIRRLFSDRKNRYGFQVTIHKIPHTPFTIGYLPKGIFPTQEMINELIALGKKEQCIFIQLEPNTEKDSKWQMANSKWQIVGSARPLFTKYTFILDLTKSEEELLKDMHSKTRYNLRVAQKHGVIVQEEFSKRSFADYWKLTSETTARQGFYAHSKRYHELMWEALKPQMENGKWKMENNELSAHLLVASYKEESGKLTPLVTWVIFVFHDTLYYPYGASSSLHRETMASNLMMWEAIKYGKKLGLKKFDMWGALESEPDIKDAWYGFHRFKQGYGPHHVEFIGSYDLVINKPLYELYKISDKLRWSILHVKSKLKR